MQGQIVLPAGVSIFIIAFLLALLPAGLFIWMWYLRRTDRPVPASTVVLSWLAGLALVLPAFQLEKWGGWLWQVISPETAHYFAGAALPLTGISDFFWPAVATFLVVALVEEGVRYILLRWWIGRGYSIDQVFDGLVLGVAAGLGFATLENTLYFLELFRQENFDTLVFVFFLRFLISTLAHISFGGIMGALIARGTFSMYKKSSFMRQAFLLPWFVHGLYDFLLGLNLTIYAVLVIVPPLMMLVVWAARREFFVISRKNGKLLLFEEAPISRRNEIVKKLLRQFDSPWNKNAPWLAQRAHRGALLRQLIDNG